MAYMNRNMGMKVRIITIPMNPPIIPNSDMSLVFSLLFVDFSFFLYFSNLVFCFFVVRDNIPAIPISIAGK